MGWTYGQPVKIIFGSRKIEELGNILKDAGLKNGLLVSDPFLVSNGLAEKLKEYSDGLVTSIFSDISPNPTVDSVDACVSEIRKNNNCFIVALGGGSAIDCAKAAASICKTPFPADAFLTGKQKIGTEHLELIAIPTTSGTGSEVTAVAVLSNPKTGAKAPVASPNFYPKIAIIDPLLTVSVPKFITASTGLDVLAHAVEGYWSRNHQPICDAMAIHASRLVFKYIKRAYDVGSDIEAREKMSEASVIAGLAFGLPKTTGPHACSYPLTSIYKMSHGEACAFTLDVFMRINADADSGRVRELAQILGFADANAMADKVYEMKKHMGMKMTLTDACIKVADIPRLAELSQHPNMLNNPVEMSLDGIAAMYRSLE